MLSGVRRLYRCDKGGGYHKLVILQTYYQVSGVEVIEDLEGWQQLAEDRSPGGGHKPAGCDIEEEEDKRYNNNENPVNCVPGDQVGEDGQEQILYIDEGVEFQVS